MRFSFIHNKTSEFLKRNHAQRIIRRRRVEPHAQPTRRRVCDRFRKQRAFILQQHDVAGGGGREKLFNINEGNASVRFFRNHDRVLAAMIHHHDRRARGRVIRLDRTRLNTRVAQRINDERTIDSRATKHAHARATHCRRGRLIRAFAAWKSRAA